MATLDNPKASGLSESSIIFDSAPVRDPHPSVLARSSYDGIWTQFNRLVGTAVLLFMAATNFNLIGFVYFLLFILHTYAYYSFRGKSNRVLPW